MVGGCCGTTPAHIAAICRDGARTSAATLVQPSARAKASDSPARESAIRTLSRRIRPRSLRARATQHHTRVWIRRHRRAHQHHRFAEVFETDPGRRFRRRRRSCAAAGRERSKYHRHQCRRRNARFRSDDDTFPKSRLAANRKSRACRS